MEMTMFATSLDGTKIAYDCSGTGPAVILLHGGGASRQEWQAAGYVQRLQNDFTVIALDLRGHGKSGSPSSPSDYAIDKLLQDILAVADACGAARFALWGMSFGGKVGRYLATRSERVKKAILMGTPLGPGVSGKPRQDAIDFCAHWPPIIQAQREGRLDVSLLPAHDQEMLKNLNIPAMLGWVPAMLDWPVVEPADFLCPTLWLVGSEDQPAIESVQAFAAALKGSLVQVQIIEGLDHEQVFDQIYAVFPAMLAFTRS
jgi:pimeloyl-ACP methyl ester carboxylesterase